VGVVRKTAIIVPCYNEAGRLRPREFAGAAYGDDNLNFVFVNDGSTDGTADLLMDLCRENRRQLHFVTLDRNAGKAEAVRRGVLSALEADYEFIGFWDADLATPLSELSGFHDLLERTGVNMVIGSRVRLLGRAIERRALRHYAGRVFATLASLILNIPVYDTQCGAKLFRNTPEFRVVFRKPFRSIWTFDVEIFARFLLIERFSRGISVATTSLEYPLEKWSDVAGSKVRPSHFAAAAFELLRIYLYLRAPGARRRFESL
jgi:glycosyltransferase involved in cell wall biosynthesis